MCSIGFNQDVDLVSSHTHTLVAINKNRLNVMGYFDLTLAFLWPVWWEEILCRFDGRFANGELERFSDGLTATFLSIFKMAAAVVDGAHLSAVPIVKMNLSSSLILLHLPTSSFFFFVFVFFLNKFYIYLPLSRRERERGRGRGKKKEKKREREQKLIRKSLGLFLRLPTWSCLYLTRVPLGRWYW